MQKSSDQANFCDLLETVFERKISCFCSAKNVRKKTINYLVMYHYIIINIYNCKYEILIIPPPPLPFLEKSIFEIEKYYPDLILYFSVFPLKKKGVEQRPM